MKKILVADDDRDFVEMTRIVLETNGYRVIEANDGQSAYETAVSEAPDLIILDVMMNTISEGFDVARKLRQNESTKSIPIIILTSIHSTEYRPPDVLGKFEPDQEWLPVDSFIDKPVKPVRLLSEVKKLLEAAR